MKYVVFFLSFLYRFLVLFQWSGGAVVLQVMAVLGLGAWACALALGLDWIRWTGVLACVCLALCGVGGDALRWKTARWAFPWCPILRSVRVPAAGGR